jgi:hypothetical protein
MDWKKKIQELREAAEKVDIREREQRVREFRRALELDAQEKRRNR